MASWSYRATSDLDIERARELDPPPRESAVLALVYPKDSELHCLLMVRPMYDGVHSGQVAFPGGKQGAGRSHR